MESGLLFPVGKIHLTPLSKYSLRLFPSYTFSFVLNQIKIKLLK